MTLPIAEPHLAPWGWLREQSERNVTQDYVEKLRIVLRSINQPVRELSGGNQQKVVISKWLLSQPKIMILDEPTRGIDIGAKSEVHRLMGELAAQGMAILMISSELPEVLAMSDRILVMREGRMTGRFDEGRGHRRAHHGGSHRPGPGRGVGNLWQRPSNVVETEQPARNFASQLARFRELGIILFLVLIVVGQRRSPSRVS